MRLIRLLKQDLAEEVRSWVEEGLIDQLQGERICARYGVSYQDTGRLALGYRVLMLLGYLFIGLSLLTLIGANWDEIPRAVRAGGLFALVLSVQLFGWRQAQLGRRGSAIAWFFLGSLCYGAAIMLIAQIYHLGEHYPDGIFWWALGVLPFAMLMRSQALSTLMLMLALVWFVVELSLGYLAWQLPLFLVASLLVLIRTPSNAWLFLLLVASAVLYLQHLLFWWVHAYSGVYPLPEGMVLAMGLCLLLWVFGTRLLEHNSSRAQDYGLLVEVWVSRFLIFTLFVFSFHDPWQELMAKQWQLPYWAFADAVLLLIASLVLARSSVWHRLAIVMGGLFYLGWILGVQKLQSDSQLIGWVVADNLLLLVLGIALIVRGISESASHWFYGGVMVILLLALLRYIDLVGDYLGAALLFAVFAGVLLGAARFWRARHSAQAQ